MESGMNTVWVCIAVAAFAARRKFGKVNCAI